MRNDMKISIKFIKFDNLGLGNKEFICDFVQSPKQKGFP